MLRAITSLVWNALPYRRGFAASLALRSQLRQLTSLPSQAPVSDWDNMVEKNIKVKEQLDRKEKTPAEIWKERSDESQVRRGDQTPASTYSGRSVFVKNGNVGDAYSRLQTILYRNRVQIQLRQTERHEKKGVKRRRLCSERWRKRFAHEVRKKVQLVAKIRNRGA
ncbi:hypothetical protein C0992_010876 [Termitomyces sp. T32_za158]|nr:hypothetical protein C0992_010876 [Termitomyces sp. T32_za158]